MSDPVLRRAVHGLVTDLITAYNIPIDGAADYGKLASLVIHHMRQYGEDVDRAAIDRVINNLTKKKESDDS